jgi:hypothetical protein
LEPGPRSNGDHQCFVAACVCPLKALNRAGRSPRLCNGLLHNYLLSETLLSMNGRPMFEYGLKAMAGQLIKFLARDRDYPDRERLAERVFPVRGSMNVGHSACSKE